MMRSKSKRSKNKSPSKAITEVRCVGDLHAALMEIVSARSRDSLCQLEGILEEIQRDFDPTSITMTSTNIPDSLAKLSSVLTETGEAARRVFHLVERQRTLLEENEAHLAALEGLLRGTTVDTDKILQMISESRTTQAALRELSHEFVMAQGFQDLCSQKVEKVMKLVDGLDVKLRALLAHFKIAPKCSVSTQGKGDSANIGQGAADEILKGFGI
ncbi:MAG: chemotaxis protein CheZ [Pseudomonadota bacterium]|jgi:chemotaxis regulatin CheY-phosphate phosphatase CheZ